MQRQMKADIIKLYLSQNYASRFAIQGHVYTFKIVTTCSAIILLLNFPSSCFYTKHTTYNWQTRFLLQA